jgi:hypothetical protein
MATESTGLLKLTLEARKGNFGGANMLKKFAAARKAARIIREEIAVVMRRSAPQKRLLSLAA